MQCRFKNCPHCIPSATIVIGTCKRKMPDSIDIITVSALFWVGKLASICRGGTNYINYQYCWKGGTIIYNYHSEHKLT